MVDELTPMDGSGDAMTTPSLPPVRTKRGARPKPTTSGSSALSIRGLHAYYGTAHVLHGIDFEAAEGSAVAVLGRNGAGKSTMLKSIAGTADLTRVGVVQVGDTELQAMRADQVARCGVQLVPEDRRVLTGLSVRENLDLAARGARVGRGVDYVARILSVFPGGRGVSRLRRWGTQRRPAADGGGGPRTRRRTAPPAPGRTVDRPRARRRRSACSNPWSNCARSAPPCSSPNRM